MNEPILNVDALDEYLWNWVTRWGIATFWMLKQLWTYLKAFDSKPPEISLLIIKTYIVIVTYACTTYGQVQRSFTYTILLLQVIF